MPKKFLVADTTNNPHNLDNLIDKPLPVSEGGTGASDAPGARSNLGLGSASTQPSSAFDPAGAATTAGAAAVASSLQKAANLSDVSAAATARTNLGLGTAATQASTAFDASGAAATVQASSLQKSSNLSDVSSAATARTNLGLGTAATQAISAFLQASNNLSDVISASLSRSNLGLGTAATQAATVFLQVANNLSDLANTGTARSNLGAEPAITAGTSAQYWRGDKTWQNFNAAVAAAMAPNVLQAQPSNPSGTTSSTGLMMGLNASITPNKSGCIGMFIQGSVANTLLGNGAIIQMRYGTGTAPTNGAALTGTTIGAQSVMANPSLTLLVPGIGTFGCNGVVTGLTLGTTYWVDVSLARLTGGTATITNVSVTLFEL